MKVVDVLKIVRKDPHFHLYNEKSLRALYVFLAGFETGVRSCGQMNTGLDELRPFNKWLAARLGCPGSAAGWCEMISQKTDSDERAFDYFFELLDLYQSESDIGIAKTG